MNEKQAIEQYDLPDDSGHFGPYGGSFVSETLMQPLEELNQAYKKYLSDQMFPWIWISILCQFFE